VEGGPPQHDPADELPHQHGNPQPAAGRQQRAEEASQHDDGQVGVHRLVIPVGRGYLKLWPADAVVLPGGSTMFRWMLFLVLILAGILAFVTWVMGVPIPGLSQFGIQQPTSPFGP
jgi:hypothetical protein